MKKSFFVCSLALVFLLPDRTLADRRQYTWTYEYQTMQKGEAEIEHYLTATPDESLDFDSVTYEHFIEVEYGITDRWDLSMYQLLKQAPDSGLFYNGYKLRTRYRFGSTGRWFVDPLLYLEWVQKRDEVEIEGKVILAKTMGRLNISYNLVLEEEFEREVEVEEETGEEEIEWEPEFIVQNTFGIAYAINPHLSIGLEGFSHTELVGKGMEYEHTAFFAGPVLSLSAPQGRVWWTVSWVRQVTDVPDEHDPFMVRSLLGILL